MKPLVSMRAALGDDDLLGKALPGPSWSSWRTLLIACMGEPLLEVERAVFAELTGGREREPGEPAEEVHAIVGRRSGKTRAAATTATYLATLCDHLRPACPGRARGAAAVERDDLAGDAGLQSDPGGIFPRARLALASLIESETADTLRLRNAVDIECRPASFRTISGATAIAFIADEVGFWFNAEQARNPDSEILRFCGAACASDLRAGL